MNELFHFIYSRSLQTNLVVMLMMVFVCTTINMLWISERKKYFNLCMLFGEIMMVLYITVFNRGIGEGEICLIPFYSFVIAQEQSEIYRSMFMNVLLFVPFGLFLPYGQEEFRRGKIKTTLLSAFFFSCFVEILQYVFMLGRAEVDDVICNVLGALVGSLSFGIYSLLQRKEIHIKGKE